MAEVMDMPVESLDRRRDRQSDRRERSSDGSPPPPPRRRDRDSRERRDDRDDRPANRRSGDYHERDRDRDYKRRLSTSPSPYGHRDRRHSPPRRSPPPPMKRSRRDDGGYDNRRGSPRFGYDYGGYDRGALAGRPGYPDERPHGRYMNRSTGGYQGALMVDVEGGLNALMSSEQCREKDEKKAFQERHGSSLRRKKRRS
ncbi:hypothetical protein ACLOJK_017350 [Asimina triloba]